MVGHGDRDPWGYTGPAGNWRIGPEGDAVTMASVAREVLVLASGVGAFRARRRFRRRRKILRHLLQAFTEGLSHTIEDLGARLAKFFFRGRGDSGNHFARLMIQRRHGCQHPLV